MKHGLALRAMLAAMLFTAASGAQAAAAGSAAAPRKVEFLLNSGFSGANAWFLLAVERGYFREEGIEVEFIDGRGAFTAAGRVAREGYDFGYGDMQAVIEQAAVDAKTAPIAVYMLMDHSPSVIAVPAASAVTKPADTAGLTITGHGTDVALNTFAQYAGKAGVDSGTVTIIKNDGDWKTLLGLLRDGKTNALFGYSSTISAAVRSAGQEPGAVVRFLKYVDVVPELYGSVLMVAPRVARSEPKIAAGFVRAVNRGVMDAVCDPDAAIAALVRKSPSSNPAVERGRLVQTVMEDMGGKDRLANGIGGVEPVRLATVLSLTATGRKLSRQPKPGEVFTATYLPPAAQRRVRIGIGRCKPL